ncbi:MAG: hypothetical protein ABSF09_12695 [Candidatus Bathyarchaeia archaeon]|jgi:hypothetical protein
MDNSEILRERAKLWVRELPEIRAWFSDQRNKGKSADEIWNALGNLVGEAEKTEGSDHDKVKQRIIDGLNSFEV